MKETPGEIAALRGYIFCGVVSGFGEPIGCAYYNTAVQDTQGGIRKFSTPADSASERTAPDYGRPPAGHGTDCGALGSSVFLF